MTTTYDKSFGATAYLTFNDTQIALTAADVKHPKFIYRADSFYTAPSLGELNKAISSIAGKMGEVIDEKIKGTIENEIENLTEIPVLKQVLTSELVVTDFVINVPEKVYEFGLGLRLPKEDNTLGPVTLDGISILVKMTGRES
jgi:hypothetical protein